MNNTTKTAAPKSDTCKLCAKAAHGARCKRCHVKHMRELRAIADAQIAIGVCPCCGTKLVRNAALTGWYQCGAYASVDFRKPEFRGLPSCGYQVFGS